MNNFHRGEIKKEREREKEKRERERERETQTSLTTYQIKNKNQSRRTVVSKTRETQTRNPYTNPTTGTKRRPPTAHIPFVT